LYDLPTQLPTSCTIFLWLWVGCPAIATLRGGIGIALCIPNLGAGRGWEVNATTRALYPWERETAPAVQEAGWASVTIWTNSEELAATGIRIQDSSILSRKWLFPYTALNFWHRSFTFNSNKSPTWYNHFSVYYPDVCLQLNMFRTFSRPSSEAQWRQWQPLVSPSYRGDSRAVFLVGPAGSTTNTARLWPRYEGKTANYHCSHWAPDDGRKNAQNMLSCKQKSG
jgi:hypothetical protein